MPNLGPFIISGLSTGALYALSAVGLVVLYRASGVVNLAQGAIGALSAIIAWQIAEFRRPAMGGLDRRRRRRDRDLSLLRPVDCAAARP